MGVCVCACGRDREIESVCVCACMKDGELERVRMRKKTRHFKTHFGALSFCKIGDFKKIKFK